MATRFTTLHVLPTRLRTVMQYGRRVYVSEEVTRFVTLHVLPAPGEKFDALLTHICY